MKNILLTGLHHIVSSPENTAFNFTARVDRFDLYQRMQEISIESFRQNLAGDWHWINLCEQFDCIQDAFRYTMNKTCELWYQESCNILFVDPDTYCVKPTEIFGKPFAACCQGNCGVRYFPHNMDSRLWLKAKHAMTQWNYKQWDYEQYIYADVMKSPLENHERFVSDIVMQCYRNSHLVDSSKYRFFKKLAPYHILHLHSTQNLGATITAMEFFQSQDALPL
jgi:hypothetical protein